MNEYMGNKLTKEEADRVMDLAAGMREGEIRSFLFAIDSKYLWEELMRREREGEEKLHKLKELILDA